MFLNQLIFPNMVQTMLPKRFIDCKSIDKSSFIQYADIFEKEVFGIPFLEFYLRVLE